MQSLPERYQALIIGASSALGAARVNQLQRDLRCGRVVCLCRSGQPTVDCENLDSTEQASMHMRALGPYRKE